MGNSVKATSLEITSKDLSIISRIVRECERIDKHNASVLREAHELAPNDYWGYVYNHSLQYRDIKISGIRYVGEGISRVGFYSEKTGRVYKYAKNGKGNSWQSENEWSQWLTLRAVDNSDSLWTIPDLGYVNYLGHTVIVMPFLGESAGNCFRDYTTPNPYAGMVGDTHPGNVREYNGRYYIIDLGI